MTLSLTFMTFVVYFKYFTNLFLQFISRCDPRQQDVGLQIFLILAIELLSASSVAILRQWHMHHGCAVIAKCCTDGKLCNGRNEVNMLIR